jgi:hypothetical protein
MGTGGIRKEMKAEGKKPPGKPRYKWEESIKIDITEIRWGGMQ